ncbi:MAG: hypothetical protein KGO92_03275 [Bacteroidota bacterium]|nr:hypothetical protein [Bacteroidota bacterium]
MQTEKRTQLIDLIISESENLIPEYMLQEEDRLIAHGNCAICLIDEEGKVYGKMYGTNLIRARESFRVAWTKASQVHITGMKTSEYEKLAFTHQIDERKFGIERPDYIGWVGGQPLTLSDGSVLSVGFSGFRGEMDLEIVCRALEIAQPKISA